MPNITENFILGFTIGVLVGLIIGLVSALILSKKSIKFEKVIGTVMFLTWIGMHIYGFINHLPVTFIFDVVGGVATGAMLGAEVSEDIITLIMNKAKLGQKK